MNTIPIEEAPGCASQGDGRGGISTAVRFHLRTTDMFYPADSDEREALEALGFDFAANGSPHTATKVGNPSGLFQLETIAHLMNFIAKHGPVSITPGNELIILGNSGHHLSRLTQTGTASAGYTSLNGQPAKD